MCYMIVWQWQWHLWPICDITLYIHVIYSNLSDQLTSLSYCQVWFTPGWKSAKWTWRWVDLWNDLGFSLLLQLRNLSVGLGKEPYIGFTQENSMENSLQNLFLLIYLCPWSMLRLHYFYPKVHASTSCPITHPP